MNEAIRQMQELIELHHLAAGSPFFAHFVAEDGELFKKYLDSGSEGRPPIVTTRLLDAWNGAWREFLSGLGQREE